MDEPSGNWLRTRRAFTFAFDDPHWFRKMLVVGLVGLIPFFGQIAQWGWGVEICRRAVRGEPAGVPELRFRAHLREGAGWLMVMLGWLAPAVILALLAAGGYNLPRLILRNPAVAETLAAVLSAVFGVLLVLYALLLPMILAAAAGLYAAMGGIRPALSLRNTMGALRKAPVAYALFLPIALLQAILCLSGGLFCGVGIVVTSTFSLAAGFYFMGTVRLSLARRNPSAGIQQ
jgi:hypothetical protein